MKEITILYSYQQAQPLRSNLQGECTANNLHGETIPIACSCSFLDFRNNQLKQSSNFKDTNCSSNKNIKFGNDLEDKKKEKFCH
jgi:hypothetical protein